VKEALDELSGLPPEALITNRLEKFQAMGVFQDAGAGAPDR
jgi:acetyl-CoA carboxylase alpha subunit